MNPTENAIPTNALIGYECVWEGVRVGFGEREREETYEGARSVGFGRDVGYHGYRHLDISLGQAAHHSRCKKDIKGISKDPKRHGKRISNLVRGG